MNIFHVKPLLAGLVLSVLAGCASVQPVGDKGEVISFQQVLSETRGKPYGCAFFDGESESCLTQTVYTAKGNDVFSTVRSGVRSRKNSRVMKTRFSYSLVNGALCVTDQGIRIEFEGGQTAHDQRFINAVKGVYRNAGRICDTFYRSPQGGYVVESRDTKGRLLPFGRFHMQFFEHPHALRTF